MSDVTTEEGPPLAIENRIISVLNELETAIDARGGAVARIAGSQGAWLRINGGVIGAFIEGRLWEAANPLRCGSDDVRWAKSQLVFRAVKSGKTACDDRSAWEVIESSPFLTAIMLFMDERAAYEGLAVDLLAKIKQIAHKYRLSSQPPTFPVNASWFGRRLKNDADPLRAVGIVAVDRHTSAGTVWAMGRIDPEQSDSIAVTPSNSAVIQNPLPESDVRLPDGIDSTENPE